MKHGNKVLNMKTKIKKNPEEIFKKIVKEKMINKECYCLDSNGIKTPEEATKETESILEFLKQKKNE